MTVLTVFTRNPWYKHSPMWIHALASDYDGTLAHDGVLSTPTVEALERFTASGRALLMVTGRELPDLQSTCPYLDRFTYVVAENGALLFRPATGETKVLGSTPHADFLKGLRAHGVPFSVGHSIVATWAPHETMVLNLIKELGLELQVIFNKGAVMILPAGVNKASGLRAALGELGLSRFNVVGVGDAENDHALLEMCGCGVAVSNALEALKDRADYVTAADHGDGVQELIGLILDGDIRAISPRLTRHGVDISRSQAEAEVLSPLEDSLRIVRGDLETCVAFTEKVFRMGYAVAVVDLSGSLPDNRDWNLRMLETASRSELTSDLERVSGVTVFRAQRVPEDLEQFESVRGIDDLREAIRASRRTRGVPHWTLVIAGKRKALAESICNDLSHGGACGPILAFEEALPGATSKATSVSRDFGTEQAAS